jgi:hypothetical protein
VQEDDMGKNDHKEEPLIEVTATPIEGSPTKMSFPWDVSSGSIAGSTVPYVSKQNVEASIDTATAVLDVLKDTYISTEKKLVIRVTEKEETDRGWWSHFDFSVSLGLDLGKWEATVKGVPKKEKRTKEKTIEVSLDNK